MPVSLKERVYEHVRSKIAHGELAPGDQLSHRELAKELGVSYTPVREAINQLANEGLVECHPRRGTFVAVLGHEDLGHMYDLRTALETHAMEKLAGKISNEVLSEVREHNDQLRTIVEEVKKTKGELWASKEARVWLLCDKAIHLTLLCEAGNPHVVKTIQNTHLPHVTGQLDQMPPLEGLRFAVDSHDALFNLLEQGKAEAARHVMAQHIQHAYLSAIRALEDGHWGKVTNWEGDEHELPKSLARRIKMLEMGF